jgi:hypothetical protein
MTVAIYKGLRTVAELTEKEARKKQSLPGLVTTQEVQ